MPKFWYRVWVETDTVEHADTVLAERLGYDEDYGFVYKVDVSPLVLVEVS